MPMFRGGYRRYLIFMRRCSRDGMIASLLLIGSSLWGLALGQAVVDLFGKIANAPSPWDTLARMVAVMAAIWIVIAISITLFLAWHRYREDQDKFIKAITEK